MTARRIAGPAGALNCRVEGAEDAPWIVLSNSLGADLTMWDPQVPVLAPHFRVLRYDTRGHGASDAPPGPYAMADLVADMVAVMDAHGVARADVLGLSLGGMTGLGLAIHHPGRLHRLVCADARAEATEAFRANFAARLEKVRTGGLAAVADGTVESWLTADWRAANPEAAAAVRAMILRTDPAGYAACIAALEGLDYFRDLGKIAADVLYIGGDRDLGAPPELMAAMAAATPRGRHVVIADAAHVASLNRPAAFNAELAAFLSLPA